MHTLHKSAHQLFVVGATALALSLAVGCTPVVQPPPAAAERAAPVVQSEFDVQVTAEGITAPAALPSGIVTFQIDNAQPMLALLALARLNDGVTLDEFAADMQAGGERIFELTSMLGGGIFGPGSGRIIFDLQPGTHILAVFGEGAPLVAVTEVSAEQVSPAAAPTADVQIDLVDFAFVMPDTVPSGPQLWGFTNTGQQPHEMGITALPAGTTLPQLLDQVHQSMTTDGPPTNQDFLWPPVAPGARAWVELDLKPGTYGAICMLPDFAAVDRTQAQAHVDMGMVRIFTVIE
jgi:hypothetical protein